MRRTWMALLAAGCAGERALPPLPTWDTPTGDAPDVVLAVSPLAPGRATTFTVRPARSDDVVFVAWSTVGPGDGPCLDELDGRCLGLVDPEPLIGPVIPDFSGAATVSAELPLDGDDTVWAQAFVVPAYTSPSASQVAERPVFDPAVVRIGDLRLTNQADVDGLAGIAAVTGELRIEATDLSAVALPELVQVGGGVYAWENDALGALTLPRLTWVGGDVSLYDDPALADLGGLSALTEVGGSLSINRMPAVASLAGLDQVGLVGGDVYVYHDDALSDLDGLSGLRTVGHEVDLWELPALTRARMPALERLDGKLDLFQNPALTELAFPSLRELGAYELQHCDALTGVGAFGPELSTVNVVNILYQDALTSLDGFAGLTRITTLSITFSGGLTSLAGLSSLSEVTLDLELQRLGALTAIDLPAVASVGQLTVRRNEALVDPGMAMLTEIGRGTEFFENTALPQCAIEALLDRVDAAGGLGGDVVCAGNLDDGCDAWCTAATVP